MSFIWWFYKINTIWTNSRSFAQKLSVYLSLISYSGWHFSFIYFLFFHPFLSSLLLVIGHLTSLSTSYPLCILQLSMYFSHFFSNTHSHSSLFFHRQFCFPSWHNCPASRFPLGLNEQGQFLVAALWLTIWCQFLFWQMLTSTSSLNSSQLLPLLLKVVKVLFLGAESL